MYETCIYTLIIHLVLMEGSYILDVIRKIYTYNMLHVYCNALKGYGHFTHFVGLEKQLWPLRNEHFLKRLYPRIGNRRKTSILFRIKVIVSKWNYCDCSFYCLTINIVLYHREHWLNLWLFEGKTTREIMWISLPTITFLVFADLQCK